MGRGKAAIVGERRQVDRGHRRVQVGGGIEPCTAVGVDVVAQRDLSDDAVAAGVRGQDGIAQRDLHGRRPRIRIDASSAGRRVVGDGRVGDGVARRGGEDASAVGARAVAADRDVDGAQRATVGVDATALLRDGVSADRDPAQRDGAASGLRIQPAAGLGLVAVDPAVADRQRALVADAATADRRHVAADLGLTQRQVAAVVDAGAAVGGVVLDHDVGHRHRRASAHKQPAALRDVAAALDRQAVEAHRAAQHVEDTVGHARSRIHDRGARTGPDEADAAADVEVARAVRVLADATGVGQSDVVGARRQRHGVAAAG